MANVTEISSLQAAVSWALNNVEIPRGNKPLEWKWVPTNPSIPDPVSPTPPSRGHIPLPTQPHKTDVFKIEVSKLAGLTGSAIVDFGALKQIASSATHQAAVLQDAKLGVFE